VASARQIASDFTGPVAFSPDGARVAVFEGANLATKDQKIGVLETASGRLTTIPKSGAFTWASNDELLFAYMRPGERFRAARATVSWPGRPRPDS
jgi:hypothetical protein